MVLYLRIFIHMYYVCTIYVSIIYIDWIKISIIKVSCLPLFYLNPVDSNDEIRLFWTLWYNGYIFENEYTSKSNIERDLLYEILNKT